MLPIPPRRHLLLAFIISLIVIIIISMTMTSCSARRTVNHHTTTLDSLRIEQSTDTARLILTQSELATATQTAITRDSIVIEEWFYPSVAPSHSGTQSQFSFPISPFHQGDSVAAIPTNATVSAASSVDYPSTPHYRRTTAILQSEINLTAQRELNRCLDSLVTAHAAIVSHTRALEDSIATSTTTGTAALTPQQLAISRYANLLIVILLFSAILFCLYFLINRMK